MNRPSRASLTAMQAVNAALLEDLPFPPTPIEEMLRLLVKAMRAQTMYLPNNPMYTGAADAVRASFAAIWAQAEEVSLAITETEIRWNGYPVMLESTKAPDSLPWTFFKDGVREVRLMAGFEDAELATLLDILRRVRKAAPEEDDLLTMLWEADFTHLRYRYVDVGGEPGVPLDGVPADTTPATPDAVREGVRAASAQPDGVISIQDFDASLYFLDDNELGYLRQEIEREYASNLPATVLASLLDIFEAQPAPAIRDEVANVIESMLLSLLAAGDLRTAAYLLAECEVAVARGLHVTPDQRARLGQLPDRLSMPEPLGQLLQALDQATDPPDHDALAQMTGQLRPAALGTILGWLPRVRSPDLRTLLEAATERLIAANPAEIARLVLSKDEATAAEAMRRATAMKLAAAVPAIARVLAEGAAPQRLAAVAALTAIESPGAMQALERSLDDPDRDVRVGAARTLGARAHRGAFARLEQAIKGKKLKDADLTERTAFFEAYGAMCGDAGVPFLAGLLNSKTLFGGREDPQLRACAALALGRVASPAAREALQRAASEKDIVVRNAVTRALRGGKE